LWFGSCIVAFFFFSFVFSHSRSGVYRRKMTEIENSSVKQKRRKADNWIKECRKMHMNLSIYMYWIGKRLCVALNNNNKIKLRSCTTNIREKRAETRWDENISSFFFFFYRYIYLDHHSFFSNNNNKNNNNSSWVIFCILSSYIKRFLIDLRENGKPFFCIFMYE
jgi:hypothetical protein